MLRLTDAEPIAGQAKQLEDVVPVAHRLALELECLLLDTKDNAVVSKWWDSAHEALEQWRELYERDQPHISPLGMD